MQNISQCLENTKKVLKKLDRPLVRVTVGGGVTLLNRPGGKKMSLSADGEHCFGALTVTIAAVSLLFAAHCWFFCIRRKITKCCKAKHGCEMPEDCV